MGRLIVAAAVLAAVAPCGVAADPAYVAFQKAEDAAAADRPADAEPLYREAIRTGDLFIRRRAYLRLAGEFVRSGRQDRAIDLGREFRGWLQTVKDREGEAELDTILGDCYATLGHLTTAAGLYDAALAPGTGLPTEGKLRALRGRAAVADAQKNFEAADRHWADLAKEAIAAVATAEAASVLKMQIVARSHLAAALHRLNDTTGALAALEPLPGFHDRLQDPLGRRDTQRQRANLLAAAGKYAEAVPLYEEALELHRKHRPKRRLAAADILAEWTTAATTAKVREKAGELRTKATNAYAAVLKAPDPADQADGGPLAAFVKLQLLNREARNFDQAWKLAREEGRRWDTEPLLELRLKTDQGGLDVLHAAYAAGRDLLTKSVAELDRADTPDLRALPQVLVQLATAELAGDDLEKARPLLDKCADLYKWHKIPVDPVWAECEYLRGVEAAGRGDYKTAIGFYRDAKERCKVVGKTADPVKFNVLLSTALIHKDQLDTAAALATLSEAGDVLRTFADPDDRNAVLIDAARIDLHVTRAEVRQAAKLVPSVLAGCEKYSLSGFALDTAKHAEALDLFARGETVRAQAKWAELAGGQRSEKSTLLARTLNHLGLAAEKRGDAAAALRLYEEALDFAEKRPAVPAVTRAITRWRLGTLADAAGKRAEAKQHLARVFDIADDARLRTFGGADPRARFYLQFRQVFEQLAGWHVRDGDAADLVAVVARTRSRTLLDQTNAAGVDPRDSLAGPERGSLLALEATAREKVSRLRAKLHVPSGESKDAVAARQAADELVRQLDQAQAELFAVCRDIAAIDPAASALAGPERRGIPPGLGAKTAVIVYVIGPTESAAVLYPRHDAPPELFRLTLPARLAAAAREPTAVAYDGCGPGDRRGLTLVGSRRQPGRPTRVAAEPIVPLSEVVAGRLVSQYLQQVVEPDFTPNRGVTIASPWFTDPVVAPAELLGDAVLPAGLRERLRAAGAERVVVVPDGPLHRLPLECLPVSTPNGPEYGLLELPPVAYAPSLGLLGVALRRPAADGPATLLTVGDPAYPDDACDLPRLPGSETESKRVRRDFPADRVTHLLKSDATEWKVAEAVRGKRFVHLAAHGFADVKFGGQFAAVALAPPPGSTRPPDDDGFLLLHEVHRLRLTGCELTVLSACVTHVGPQKPLEAGVTLAGAFLCAGSRRVVATCWSVDDRATAALVGEFFSRAVKPDGAPPAPYADALKAARLHVRSQPGWQAPCFWAGLVLVGPPE